MAPGLVTGQRSGKWTSVMSLLEHQGSHQPLLFQKSECRHFHFFAGKKKWKMCLPSDRMSNADPWYSAGQAKHHFDFPGNRGGTVLMYLRWGKDSYRPERVLSLLFDSISHSYPSRYTSWCRNTWHKTDIGTEGWEQNQTIFSRGDPWALPGIEAGRPGAFRRFTSAHSEGGLTLGSSERPPG